MTTIHGTSLGTDAFRLDMEISGAIYDDFCQRSSWRFGGNDYELADSVEGEPFTLVRKSDGRRFHVWLSAEVVPVTTDQQPGE